MLETDHVFKKTNLDECVYVVLYVHRGLQGSFLNTPV